MKDRGKQLAFRMAAADIRARLGQTEAALNEFESLLRQLNPDHGIYREVRRRIEAIYLRTEDRAGLATYYEAWLVKHPDDSDAIMRVAQTYAAFGRDESASTWLERGVKLAPSRKERRRALIDRLLEARQVSEALAHCEQLDRDEPNNSDTLRDWGRAILKDSSRDGTARRQAAAAVWRKRSEARPKNALVASQVGDSLRQGEMIDEAIDQYRRAITLAPEATQYREYLGEYFHSLKRSDDALATWRPIAEGDQRTAAWRRSSRGSDTSRRRSQTTRMPAAIAIGTQMPLVHRMAKITTILKMTSLVRTAVRTSAVPSRPTPATNTPGSKWHFQFHDARLHGDSEAIRELACP